MTRGMLKLVLIAALIGALPAFADIVAVGDPIPGDSWWQTWELYTGILSPSQGNFTKVVASGLTGGVIFHDPGAIVINPAGWSVSSSPNTVELSGPAAASMKFALHYSPEFPGTAAFKHNLTVYNNSDVVAQYRLAWDKREWSVSVPEASAAALHGSWLIGLAAAVLFRRRKNT